ncbi:MAG: EMC3/TMCO1 family protein [Candidatus Thermoplasmatota archaeon]|nr:EMC3/TMCO1 family protein [Candidatus Thermoplasmatota archaeon]
MTEGRKPVKPVAPQTTQQNAMSKMMRINMIYMFMSIITLMIITNASMRDYIGSAMSFVFMPLVGFNYRLPLLTIVLMGAVIGAITSIPRYFFTDWIKMGRIQNRMRAFNKIYNEAMKSNQKDKVQKLQKMRMEMSMEQSQMSMSTMKPLMVLTVFTLLVFAWLYFFLSNLPYQIMAFPWDFNINIAHDYLSFSPYWVVAYFFTSLTVGYCVTMIIKYFDFSYKIRKYGRTLENENNN